MNHSTKCFMCKKAKKREQLVAVFAHGTDRIVLCCKKHPGIIAEHKRYLEELEEARERELASASIKAFYAGDNT